MEDILISIRDGRKYGYINREGVIVIPARFDLAFRFYGELALISVTGRNLLGQIRQRYGYIDRTGKMVIRPRFSVAGGFFEDLARVRRGDQWGYINNTG